MLSLAPQCRVDQHRGQAIWSLVACDPERLQKTHVVLGQRNGESASPRQVGARLPEHDLQPGQLTVVSEEHCQPHGAAETNLERANVESWKKESEGIMQKLTGEKGKLDFEEQLKELDAEMSGKADTGCIMEKFLKAKELEFEVEESTDQMEERGCKVTLGCNEEKLLKAREQVSEEKVSDNKKGEREGEDFMYGLGSGPLCSGLHGILG